MSISVGSVSVDVVPDTRMFRKKLAAETKGIEVPVGLKTAELRAQLTEATRDLRATVNVDADTAAAAAKIDEVTRDRTMNVRANSSGFGAATGGVSGLTAAVLTLGPALIPVTAAVAGLGAALAAPLAAAGGGLTLFGLIAGVAVKKTKEQIKEIGKLQEKVSKAQLAVASASTPAGKKSAQEELTAQTQAYKLALSQLTPAQTRFMNAQGKLSGSFQKLVKVAGPAIFGPLVQGMNLLSKVLPRLGPVLKPVSRALSVMLTNIADFTKGPGFKSFLTGFGKDAGDAIGTFGRTLGNFAKGTFALFGAFTPLSGSFTKGIENLSVKFVKFSQGLDTNKGFQRFLAYIKDVGPKVASTFGDIVRVAVKVGIALAPLGGLVLGLVDGLAKFILHAKPSTLSAIGIAIGGVALAFGKGPLGLAFALGATMAHSDGFINFLKKAGNLAGTLGDAFNKLPDGIKAAAVAAVGVGVIGAKLKGLSGLASGLGGGLGKGGGGILGLVSKKSPVPVLVMNKGFGGGLPGKVGAGEAAAGAAGGVTALTIAGAATIAVVGGLAINKFGPKSGPVGPPTSGKLDVQMPSIVGPVVNGLRNKFDTEPLKKAAFYSNLARQNIEKLPAGFDKGKNGAEALRSQVFGIEQSTKRSKTNVDDLLALLETARQRAIKVEQAVSKARQSKVDDQLGRGGASHGATEIRGTLSLDRQGVATIHGVAKDAVKEGRAQREAVARHRAMGSESFR